MSLSCSCKTVRKLQFHWLLKCTKWIKSCLDVAVSKDERNVIWHSVFDLYLGCPTIATGSYILLLSYFAFYRACNLADCGGAPCQKYMRVWGLGRKVTRHLAHPAPKFYRVKNCEIWPQFSAAVTFGSSWFETAILNTWVKHWWLAWVPAIVGMVQSTYLSEKVVGRAHWEVGLAKLMNHFNSAVLHCLTVLKFDASWARRGHRMVQIHFRPNLRWQMVPKLEIVKSLYLIHVDLALTSLWLIDWLIDWLRLINRSIGRPTDWLKMKAKLFWFIFPEQS